LFNAFLGGFADLGYFLFVDLAGYADPPGPQMTYICATAIALSLYAALRRPASAQPELVPHRARPPSQSPAS